MQINFNIKFGFFLGLLQISSLLSGCAIFGTPYSRVNEHEASLFKKTRLPFRSDQTFEVAQGPFGRSSHNEAGNEYSWDFAVPLGTAVIAVEGGRVLENYVPKQRGSGCDKRFAKSAHNIKVEHQDGTVAQYVHVDSLVAKGSLVVRGQVIAKTADNGWLCYPHLHFGVYRSRKNLYDSPRRKTIPLYFDQVPGGLLQEGFELTDQFR